MYYEHWTEKQKYFYVFIDTLCINFKNYMYQWTVSNFAQFAKFLKIWFQWKSYSFYSTQVQKIWHRLIYDTKLSFFIWIVIRSVDIVITQLLHSLLIVLLKPIFTGESVLSMNFASTIFLQFAILLLKYCY